MPKRGRPTNEEREARLKLLAESLRLPRDPPPAVMAPIASPLPQALLEPTLEPVSSVSPANALPQAPKPLPDIYGQVDYFVGLRKTGPNLYRAVTGKIQEGKVFDVLVDHLDQPLEYAALTIRTALKNLMVKVP